MDEDSAEWIVSLIGGCIIAGLIWVILVRIFEAA